MAHIDVFVSNQKFCPEIITCEWTDTTDTYVLDSTDYGTKALARYLGIDISSWQTTTPYVEVILERSNNDITTFKVDNFESKAIRLVP